MSIIAKPNRPKTRGVFSNRKYYEKKRSSATGRRPLFLLYIREVHKIKKHNNCWSILKYAISYNEVKKNNVVFTVPNGTNN